MKTIFFIFALLAASLGAQTIPPQFAGLPTSNVDFTCGGVFPCTTWPMPAIPSAGSSWTDPNTGVALYRLTNNASTVGQALSPYSRVQAWNVTQTRMFLCETGNSSMDLYDATTTPPTPINRISTTDGSALYTCSGDAYWANSASTPNRIYYIPFDDGANSLQIRYVDVTGCTSGSGNCTLTPTTVHDFSTDNVGGTGNACTSDKYFPGMDLASFMITGFGGTNIITFMGANGTLTAGETAVIYGTGVSYLDGQSFTVSATGLSANGFQASITHANVSSTSISGIAGLAGVAGNVIESGSGGQGGFFDKTDNYFSFTCDYTGEAGRAEIDWIRYRKDTNTVTTQEKWYTVCPGNVPAGCGVWGGPYTQTGNLGYDMIRMNQHPDQAYINVLWQCGANSNAEWAVGCGTEYYSPTYTLLGPTDGYNGHLDQGYDVNGYPVYVGVNGGSGSNDEYYAVSIANLSTLSPTSVTSKVVYLPIGYAFTGGTTSGIFLAQKNNCPHVNMTGTWSTTPGYALYSTCMVDAGSYFNGGLYVPDYPPSTTLGTAVTSAGSHTVTPGSMLTIGLGTEQLIGQGGANPESVTVTGVTGSTFTATFAYTHLSTDTVWNLSVGDTGFGAMELFAVKIDSTVSNGSTAQFWRIGRAMSIRDGDYSAEPHAAVNRDWTALTWGSNWNTDNGTVYGFWLPLSGSSPPAATPANPLLLAPSIQ